MGVPVYFYRAAGVTLACEFPLPGLIAANHHHTVADVRVHFAPVPDRLDGAQNLGPNWQFDENEFLFLIPGLARFLIVGGREIRIQPEYATPHDELAAFLSGTVLGILLHQRSRIVLHASAVNVRGRAVLFCGPTGAGKSTLAAALDARGYPVISDDLCAVDVDGHDIPHVAPDGRNLKLWPRAIEHLGLERGPAVRCRIEKYYVESGAVSYDPMAIGALYVLREALPPHVAGIERPNVAVAALLIRQSAYCPALVRLMGQRARYFHAASRLAKAAGIYRLTRALEFARMGEEVGRLEDHWAAHLAGTN